MFLRSLKFLTGDELSYSCQFSEKLLCSRGQHVGLIGLLLHLLEQSRPLVSCTQMIEMIYIYDMKN